MSQEQVALKVKSILVSQPKPESDKSPYFDLAKKYNLKVDFRPFIHVEGVPLRDFRKERINIQEFGAVILTSKNAIDNFFRMCEESRFEASPELKYFCISENIGVYIAKYIQLRKRKVFYGEGKLSDLIPSMLKHKTEKFLFPCSDMNKGEFRAIFEKNNFEVKEAVMFRTVTSDLSDLSDIKYDVLAFFSPTGIKSLYENFPDFIQGNTRIAAFGESTQAAVLEANLRLDIAAPTPESPSMTMAIEQYIKKNSSK